MENYVALMRIRYTDNVDIRLQYPPVIPDVEIPPLLFTALIENAFKHGISYQHESFVHILFDAGGDKLSCTVANSLSPTASAQQKPGMGMKNIRKRLALIYAGNYTLDVRQDDKSYTVILVIPLGT
jgi:LytS/YehU family sensor histidine kinase